MRRLVVHIGAQKAASTYIQRGLYSNADLLAEHGVFLPRTGLLDLERRAIAHHQLAWALDSRGLYPRHPELWDQLALEIEESDADTVLLSSEVFAGVAADPTAGPALAQRLLGLSSHLTIVLLVRDQLSLLNSLYCQRVKMLEVVDDFTGYLRRSTDPVIYDLERSFGAWYRSDFCEFVAVPFPPPDDVDPLVSLLSALHIDVPTDRLIATDEPVNVTLGRVGIEATRLLGAYLRGKHPNFSHADLAARRLHRNAAARSRSEGWCDEPFWGWEPDQARQAAERYAASNDSFAHAVWGTDWTLPMAVDEPRSTVSLLDLDPMTIERVNRFVFAMAERFGHLVEEETAA